MAADFAERWLPHLSRAAGQTACAAEPAVTVLHASTFLVSAVTAAAYLPWLVLGLPAGAWADQLPGRGR
jgi:hypothetical protein